MYGHVTCKSDDNCIHRLLLETRNHSKLILHLLVMSVSRYIIYYKNTRFFLFLPKQTHGLTIFIYILYTYYCYKIGIQMELSYKEKIRRHLCVIV